MGLFTLLATVDNQDSGQLLDFDQMLSYFWERVTDLHWLYALLMISVGIVYMLYGWRIFRILVVISFGFLGLFLGILLGQKMGGKEIWGGLIGISGSPDLVDGGRLTAPTFSFYNLDGEWEVENQGVAPDIEVVDDPSLMLNGGDPQLAPPVMNLAAAIGSLLPEVYAAHRPGKHHPVVMQMIGWGIPQHVDATGRGQLSNVRLVRQSSITILDQQSVPLFHSDELRVSGYR